MKHLVSIILLVTGCGPFVQAADFLPLFNGRDLTGWTNVNCAPETWRWTNGVVSCTGRPIGALRTTRQYENFILDLEWRHLRSGGNSGIFIWASPIAAPGVPFLRGIEVQVLDHGFNIKGKNEWYTTHGDVFPIHGATMNPFGKHNGMRSFPSEERSKPSPEWNHYQIVCSNGVIRLSVNGKEVSGGSECNYRKGYIGLESEGAPVEFRNVRLQELPSNHITAAVGAPEDAGWRSLFNGVDFRGWQTNNTTAANWQINPNHLKSKSGSGDAVLWTQEKFGDVELVLDCNIEKSDATGTATPKLKFRGVEALLENNSAENFTRFTISVKASEMIVKRNDEEIKRIKIPSGAPQTGSIGLSTGGSMVDFMNLYLHVW